MNSSNNDDETLHRIEWTVADSFTEAELRSRANATGWCSPAMVNAARAKLAEIDAERARQIDFEALPDGTQVERPGRCLAKRHGVWHPGAYANDEMAERHAEAPFKIAWQPKTLLDHLRDCGLDECGIREFATGRGTLIGDLCAAALDEAGES